MTDLEAEAVRLVAQRIRKLYADQGLIAGHQKVQVDATDLWYWAQTLENALDFGQGTQEKP